MSDTVWAAIVGGAAGIITGVISSLLAPWANWGIEKRRQDREERELIARHALSMIIDYRRSALAGGKLTLGTSLRNNTNWIRIRTYLTETARTQIESAEQQPITSPEVEAAFGVLEAELARLRRKWKLV